MPTDKALAVMTPELEIDQSVEAIPLLKKRHMTDLTEAAELYHSANFMPHGYVARGRCRHPGCDNLRDIESLVRYLVDHPERLAGEDEVVVKREEPTKTIRWLDRHLPDPAQQREYAQQRCIEAIGSDLEQAMEAANLSPDALASKTGKSKRRIARIENMSLTTLGDLLWACDVEVRGLDLIPLGTVEITADDAKDWLAGSPTAQESKDG